MTEDDGVNDVHQNVAELNFFYGIGELILKSGAKKPGHFQKLAINKKSTIFVQSL